MELEENTETRWLDILAAKQRHQSVTEWVKDDVVCRDRSEELQMTCLSTKSRREKVLNERI